MNMTNYEGEEGARSRRDKSKVSKIEECKELWTCYLVDILLLHTPSSASGSILLVINLGLVRQSDRWWCMMQEECFRRSEGKGGAGYRLQQGKITSKWEGLRSQGWGLSGGLGTSSTCSQCMKCSHWCWGRRMQQAQYWPGSLFWPGGPQQFNHHWCCRISKSNEGHASGRFS